MKPRRLLPILASLSLLLCVGAIVMWDRSYMVADCWFRHTGHVEHRLVSNRGYLWLSRSWSADPWWFGPASSADPRLSARWRWTTNPTVPIPASSGAFLGFRRLSVSSDTFAQWQLLIPYWFPVALTGTLPACWLVPLARRRWYRLYRSAHGLCLHCGYDLTGNASGVCPECGTAIATQLGTGTQTAPKGLPVMKRRLRTIASALSLLLCVAAVALWIRSSGSCEELAWRTTTISGDTWRYRYMGVLSYSGRAWVAVVHGVGTGPGIRWARKQPPSLFSYAVSPRPPFTTLPQSARDRRGIVGFSVITTTHADSSTSRSFRAISIPYWFVVLVALALPARQMARLWTSWRRRDQDGSVRCHVCGYNLTGNVSGVCPECGTPIATTEKAPQATGKPLSL